MCADLIQSASLQVPHKEAAEGVQECRLRTWYGTPLKEDIASCVHVAFNCESFGAKHIEFMAWAINSKRGLI